MNQTVCFHLLELLFLITFHQAENMGMNPLYLMFPVTLATEFAFMLPASAPATAIALTTGRINITDMVSPLLTYTLMGRNTQFTTMAAILEAMMENNGYDTSVLKSF